MKFGSQLKEGLYPEWRFYYLDYDGLKRHLKNRTLAGSYKEGDEGYFVELLERELEKVYGFQVVKLGEINRRVQAIDERIKKLSKIVAQKDAEAGGLAEETPEETAAFAEIEDEVNQVLEEVNELARFTRLNYSGFLKIIKKHDKHTRYVLKPMFMVRLNARPFYRENFDALILQLSQLYDVVRNGGRDPTARAAASGQAGAQNFMRRTTKYWVHPDNVLELKFYVLKYLPVLLFQSSKTLGNMSAGASGNGPSSAPDPAISSVYFDNENLDLYQGRLEKTEGAEAIRLRWYGAATNTEIFVERKTHHEDWTGETSVKQRFPIKEKHVNAFVRGEYTLEKSLEKMRASGSRSETEIAALESLSTGIQRSIQEKHLRPTMRTFYNRTAFQLPGDATVRISLDTELSMVREDPFDEAMPRAGENWRRTDVGTNYPFSQLPDSEVCRFPYAVLEVKLQTPVGTDPPHWVTNLIESHLVEEVPKFSKFIHGCSTLLEPHVQLLPFWLPQMDKDIRKAPRSFARSTLLHKSRRGTSSSRNTSRNTSPRPSQRSRGSNAAGAGPSGTARDQDAIEIVIDDGRRGSAKRDDVQARALAAMSTSPVQPSGLHARLLAAHAERAERDDGDDDQYVDEEENGGRGVGTSERSPLLVGGRARGRTRARSPSIASLSSNGSGRRKQHRRRPSGRGIGARISSAVGRVFGRDDRFPHTHRRRSVVQRAGPSAAAAAAAVPGTHNNKRVVVPVRVEPKVFFANERTFLSWVHFAIVLGGLALGLLNFGDRVGRIAGVLFTLISMGILVYALYLYMWRSNRIRNREPGPYDDRVGPAVLVGVILAAVIINFYLKFSDLDSLPDIPPAPLPSPTPSP